ncbi:Lipocalin-like domain-containing protein [Andreprevotia lacus DSM 23236]|jgi:hypothetical protein|uniref:Lipocalin-like domain-containing protein n=1 Tax=Andreprevotia lacus DSM 23236 TaxID=1121001 RepID=A0A1W1X5F4_9NEIS|nr:lipocalin-like domain-containing protein [Andreprevotia lacus]SMC19174.1 Lipocalin-like domain-containing protein [Andreprevotia lacus DSM 23236]
MTHPLEGEWQLLSSDLTIGDTTYPCLPDDWRMIKMITATRFAFFSARNERPNFPSYAGTPELRLEAFASYNSGSGTWSLDNNQYVEHIEFCNFPNYVGQSIAFDISFDGDQLTMAGRYPLVSMGLGDADGHLVEVFRRLR